MTKLSKAYSKYGASMGRNDTHCVPEARNDRKFRMERVALDSGGYDNGGAYWGTGQALWRAEAADATNELNEVECFFRADDRAAAKRTLSAMYPGARFFR